MLPSHAPSARVGEAQGDPGHAREGALAPLEVVADLREKAIPVVDRRRPANFRAST